MKAARGKYTVAGVLAVLNGARFPLLVELDLEQDQPARFGCQAFFVEQGLKQLRTLRVRFGTNVSIVPLASCPHLANVQHLRVNSSLITSLITVNSPLVRIGRVV